MNFCKDCKWFRVEVPPACVRPDENGAPPMDPVYGLRIWPTCKSERAAEWKCGQEGRFFVGRVKEDGA